MNATTKLLLTISTVVTIATTFLCVAGEARLAERHQSVHDAGTSKQRQQERLTGSFNRQLQASCSDNDDCFHDHFCQASGACKLKKQGGEQCSDDYKCMTNDCVVLAGNTCSACTEDDECPVGRICNMGQNGGTCDFKPCAVNPDCDIGVCVLPPDGTDKVCVITGCRDNSDCPHDQFCPSNGVCTWKKQTSLSCKENDECMTDDCLDPNSPYVGKLCNLCVEDEDCPDGRYCNEPGTCDECTHDSCESGACEYPYGESALGSKTCVECNSNSQNQCDPEKYCQKWFPDQPDIWQCLDEKDAGEDCTYNKECASGKCRQKLDNQGIFDAGYSPTCAECDSSSECDDKYGVGTHFCDWSDDDNANVCKRKKGVSGKCSQNEGCKDHKCREGRCSECREGNDEDCSNDEVCGWEKKAFRCIPPKLVGVKCIVDEECESGKCKQGKCSECKNDSDCPAEYPVCSTLAAFHELKGHRCLKGLNQECLLDEECETSICTEGYCSSCRDPFSDDEEVCPGENQRCTNRDNDETEITVSKPGFSCRETKAQGESCVYDEDQKLATVCSTGRCGGNPPSCISCDHTNQCPAGEYCNSNRNECQPKKKVGKVCWFPKNCSSGKCEDGGDGKKYCSECSNDSDCESVFEGAAVTCRDVTGKRGKRCVQQCSTPECDEAAAQSNRIPVNPDIEDDKDGLLTGKATGGTDAMKYMTKAFEVIEVVAEATSETKVLLPKYVDGTNLPENSVNEGVKACEELDFIDEDVVAFGFHRSGPNQGLCGCFNTQSHTYGIAHRNLIPPIKILELGELTPRAVAVSLDKQLSSTSNLNMWNGNSNKKKTVKGHFLLEGDVGFNVGLGNKASAAITVDTRVLLNADPSNNGLVPVVHSEDNVEVDFVVLLSGEADVVLTLTTNKGTREVDLGEVLDISADLFLRLKGENGAQSLLMIAAGVDLTLGGICDLSDSLEILCMVFEESTSLTGLVQAYAKLDGFGLRFEVNGDIGLKYDVLEDLLNWPDDGHSFDAELSLELEASTGALSACAGVDGNTHCLAQCSGHGDCPSGWYCPTFPKFCMKKKNSGGTCLQKETCQSHKCVVGICW